MEFLRNLFPSSDFVPVYCSMWRPGLVWLHVVSDVLIALALRNILREVCSAANTIFLPSASGSSTSGAPCCFTQAYQGRVRVNSDANLHIELVKDFYCDFHLCENFDSRPPIHAPETIWELRPALAGNFRPL